MNKKKVLISILFSVLYLFPLSQPRAEYMLPYPSFMPGNKIYRISRIIDSMNTYWYFGSIAQIKYHIGLSDKYLVEAKTLMEYKQYLLATDALKRSDEQFSKLNDNFIKAKKEEIDTSQLIQLVNDAFKKHKDIETNLLVILPETFIWTPEKEKQTELPLAQIIQSSIKMKEQIVSEITEN
jgi:hypothetical protein